MNEAKKSVLQDSFISREEDIATLNKEDKKIMGNKKENVEISDFLPGATDEEIHKIEELIERIMDNMSVEMRHFNAKYYKIGFCDGLRLVIECLNNN
jgi:hypothetical protein